jgi:hypothetical protein
MMRSEDPSGSLWQQLCTDGAAQGKLPASSTVPWAIRALLGFAGWLAALFFIGFFMATVFAATQGKGLAMGITGALMLVLAFFLYRIIAGKTLFEQFALATSLTGQGLLIFALIDTLGRDHDGSPAVWIMAALIQATMAAVIGNALHRFVCTLFALCTATLAISLIMDPSIRGNFERGLQQLDWIAALCAAGVLLFMHQEGRLAQSGRASAWASAAGAALVFTLAASLWQTVHWQSELFAHSGARERMPLWQAGVWIGVPLLAFVWIEARRMAASTALSTALIGATAGLVLLLASAPAILAGLLATLLGVRRASLTWLGLGIATLIAGFCWYYSALSWTLLMKSLVLAVAGALLLGLREYLHRNFKGAQS